MELMDLQFLQRELSSATVLAGIPGKQQFSMSHWKHVKHTDALV